MNPLLVHGWDRIKNQYLYSLLGFSSHKKCKMLPNYDKDYDPITIPCQASGLTFSKKSEARSSTG